MSRFRAGLLLFCAVLWAALCASAVLAEIPQKARDAQIVILGEQHDNPTHHARQARWVGTLEPAALVFEMLTPEQAQGAVVGWMDQASLDQAIGWSGSAWPSFDMYFPIFEAAPDAVIYGAGVPREELRRFFGQPLATHPLMQRYHQGLPLDPTEQSARESLQSRAHCGALPEDMLPVMVDAQRLRDLALADAALRALRETQGTVVVITGNGHARMDWGVPAVLALLAPEVTVFSLGQGEDGADVEGVFSLTLDAPAPMRGDPCAAFKQ